MAKSKKLGIVSESNIEDIFAWSGTIHNVSVALAKNFEISGIQIKRTFSFYILSALRKLLKRHYSLLLLRTLQSQAKRKVIEAQKEGISTFFLPVESSLISYKVFPRNLKVIALTDATYHLMNGYYFTDQAADAQIGEELEKTAANRCDAIIVSSDWAKNDFIEHYKIDPKKIFMIPFPSFLPDKYQHHSFAGKLCKLLLVGVDYERKGVDTAIQVIRYLNSVYQNIHFELHIVGVENKYNITDESIKFYGRLHKNNDSELRQLIQLYNQSDLFFLPTKAECSAVVFAEACQYGLPIISTATGGVGTYVIDNYNGEKIALTAKPEIFAGKILSVLANYEKYTLNARAYYEKMLTKYAWEKSLKQVVDSTSMKQEHQHLL